MCGIPGGGAVMFFWAIATPLGFIGRGALPTVGMAPAREKTFTYGRVVRDGGREGKTCVFN